MIDHIPEEKYIYYCDFEDGGKFQPPEMRKKRPVLIISKKRCNKDCVTVIPISTVEPKKMTYCIKLSKSEYPFLTEDSWAKCDMITNLCTRRLELVRKFFRLKMKHDDYVDIGEKVKKCLFLPEPYIPEESAKVIDNVKVLV